MMTMSWLPLPKTGMRLFIDRVNRIFAPLDKQDALDRFDDIKFPDGNLYESMLTYVFLYSRMIMNCAHVRPKESSLVQKFLTNVRGDRLRERCATYKDKRSFERTAQAAIAQARKAEQAEREGRRSKSKGQAYVDFLLAALTQGKPSQASARPLFPICLLQCPSSALYDTGATANFISEELASSLPIEPSLESHQVQLFTGQKVNTTHVMTADCEFPSATGHKLTIKTKFIIMREKLPAPTVIGFPLLVSAGLIQFPADDLIVEVGDDYDDMFDVDALHDATETTTPTIMKFEEQISRILQDLPGLFEEDLSVTSTLPPFKVKTEDPDKVINVYPYRYSTPVRTEIVRQVHELEAQGIIRRSTSAFNNPIVMAKKRGGALRLCLDFRALNLITSPDSHPLPLIDNLLDHLEGAKFFAALDLKSAFHQVPMASDSCKYTAFTVDGLGKFEYCRMPFGMKNAPIQCQRALEAVLSDSLYTQALAYVDDVIIYGKDRNTFLKNLRDVLHKLHAAGLRLNAAKTVLGVEEIDYLGWRLNARGRRIAPDRLQAIRDIKPPTNLTEARSVLGLANYFRPIIERYADITEPITVLTRATAGPFAWGSSQQRALEAVKTELLTERVLRHPQPDETLHLYTDASDVAVGGMLANEEGHPIAFFSHTLNPTQRRWSTTEQECYGLYFGMTKMKRYLAGRHFVTHTDHRNLLFAHKSTNAKVIRWRLAMNEFDFDLVHIPGQENTVADTLSRLVHVSTAEASLNKRETFKAHHGGSAGHLGVRATCRRIANAGQSWPGLHKDVQQWVSECPVCQLTRLNVQPVGQHPHALAGAYPFQVVQMDHIGPLDGVVQPR
ncbi:hypothetical protein J8273_8027 [Carpediemonas membranifera]|uniref:Reverse transcriptase domain-containing protein n=1 Tax=Carpediemonas membranifera TaxID=201153 RepID=A0A8J6APX5_9EUKA|nr:hypothetical protein J8273_8027 [Carpediemonas membranifera]|eukprot:KAG9390661.1 hypothetical protein J8273_8027 [Carpediemonas membranifera]